MNHKIRLLYNICTETKREDFHQNDRRLYDIDDEIARLPLEKAMIAGASAGVMEHLVMFPIDTIKTRMQAAFMGSPQYTSVGNAIITISKQEGLSRLYRGISAIVVGAIPSHAVYFATYEYMKRFFGVKKGEHNPLGAGAAGALAVMAHDAVTTPLDVVKQRLQVYGSTYKGVLDCVKSIAAKEGLWKFYASYPVTVLLNVPYNAVQFASYETFKILVSDEQGNHGPAQELLAGAIAGASAGFISTPLDVVKTRIQLSASDHPGIGQGRIGIRIGREIYKTEGFKGFTRGAGARMIYFMPASAICWTTYETVKRLLGFQVPPEDDN